MIFKQASNLTKAKALSFEGQITYKLGMIYNACDFRQSS